MGGFTLVFQSLTCKNAVDFDYCRVSAVYVAKFVHYTVLALKTISKRNCTGQHIPVNLKLRLRVK